VAGRTEDYAIVGDMQSVAMIFAEARAWRRWRDMPQAFSHVPLVQTALNLSGHAEAHRRGGPMDERRSVPG
jgi:hypothetical protein